MSEIACFQQLSGEGYQRMPLPNNGVGVLRTTLIAFVATPAQPQAATYAQNKFLGCYEVVSMSAEPGDPKQPNPARSAHFLFCQSAAERRLAT